MKNLPRRMWISHKKMRAGRCVHRNYVRKRVWGWEECVPFDIRMVTKTMDEKLKEKEMKEQRS